MNKKQAGERKRTVTVVVGPKTLKLCEAVERAWCEKMGFPSGGLTVLAGVGLDMALQHRQKLLGLPVASEAHTHFD